MKYKNISGIFPNLMYYKYEKEESHKGWDPYTGNFSYFYDMLDYLNLSSKDYKVFSEGNCFICNKKIIDFIFNNNYEIFYNILNYENTFDINWFKRFYNISNDSIDYVYNIYKQKKLHGNNIKLMNTKKSMPDSMIEHMFERLWINVIHALNENYLILDDNILNTFNININIDDSLENKNSEELLAEISNVSSKYVNIFNLKKIDKTNINTINITNDLQEIIKNI